MVRDELLTSQGELRESKEELRAIKDDLRDQTALLDEARREATEATSSAERLTKECCGLRGDLPRGAETEAESSRARGHGPQLAHEEEGNRATLGGRVGNKELHHPQQGAGEQS